jgi:hypothetical protein
MLAPLRAAAVLVLAVALAAEAFAAGEEEFGNEPLSPANYEAWPGIADVVNDKSRIYQSWVNGNENMYYAGGADELNRVLKVFAATKIPVREVVFRPDPGVTHSFDQTKPPIRFNWHLHVVGGIAASLTGADKGELVWPKHPRLTVHTTGLDLAKLDIPDGLTFVSVDELSARTRKAIDSTNQNVRGWMAGVLAGLDSFDAANLATLEKQLTDKSDWVRLNAAGSISQFGSQAKTAIPALKDCLERPDENLKTAARNAIETIELAPPRSEQAQAHAEGLKAIKEFLEARKQKP